VAIWPHARQPEDLETIQRYVHQQGMTSKVRPLEELFEDTTSGFRRAGGVLRQRGIRRVGKGAGIVASAWAKSIVRRSPSKTGVNTLMAPRGHSRARDFAHPTNYRNDSAMNFQRPPRRHLAAHAGREARPDRRPARRRRIHREAQSCDGDGGLQGARPAAALLHADGRCDLW